MLGIGTAIIIGLIIGYAYMFACRKDGYNKNFIVGLCLLPVIVAIVILLIGSNVARAFSMAGAFALVRFRSAPGNAKDIAIVFFSMAAGLSCGLGYVVFSLVFVVIIVAFLLILSISSFGNRNEGMKQLKITIPETLNYSNVFDDIFVKYVNHRTLTRVRTTNMGTMFELSYVVRLKDQQLEKEFIDALRVKNGNLNISIGILPDSNMGQLN